jgi:hypothetical protein
VHGVGLREWVALGVLGIAGILGFMFFDPSATDGSNKEVPRDRTVLVVGTARTSEVTPAATAEPTATAVPVIKLGEPGGDWQLAYYESAKPGEGVRGAQGFGPLDIDYAGKPFPDFDDNDWRVVASQSLTLGPGRYGFLVESDGALRVQAGNAILIDVDDSPRQQTHALEFDHAGGLVVLTIELRDTGGPAFLRWGK